MNNVVHFLFNIMIYQACSPSPSFFPLIIINLLQDHIFKLLIKIVYTAQRVFCDDINFNFSNEDLSFLLKII